MSSVTFSGAAGVAGGARVHRGADLQYNLELDLEQAVRGDSRDDQGAHAGSVW